MLLGGCVQAAGRPQNGAGGGGKETGSNGSLLGGHLTPSIVWFENHKSHLSLTLILKQPQVLGV